MCVLTSSRVIKNNTSLNQIKHKSYRNNLWWVRHWSQVTSTTCEDPMSSFREALCLRARCNLRRTKRWCCLHARHHGDETDSPFPNPGVGCFIVRVAVLAEISWIVLLLYYKVHGEWGCDELQIISIWSNGLTDSHISCKFKGLSSFIPWSSWEEFFIQLCYFLISYLYWALIHLILSFDSSWKNPQKEVIHVKVFFVVSPIEKWR
jgi:hypothetical protein